jgi:putative spermidine/putrescine transport system permease protein
MKAGTLLTLLALLAYVFLLAPLVVVVAVSFSSSTTLAFPPSGFSLRWYAALADNATLMAALRVSAALAAGVTVIALAAGVPAAWAIARGRVPAWVQTALTAPLLLPSLVLGLGLLLALHPLGLVATWPGLMLAHACVVLPFVVRILTSAFRAQPREMERAAAALGAAPWQAVWRVSLPLALPGLLAAATLAFLLSFDETVISLFLVGPRLSTLPVELFRYTQNRTDPLVAALSVVLILVALIAVVAVERLMGLTRAMGRR